MDLNIYDFTSFTKWVDTALNSFMSPGWAMLVELVIVGIVFIAAYAVIGLYLVLAERKVCAIIQNRQGPNRVGPFGLFQTIADLLKLLGKELIHIKNADQFLFNLAPFILIIASFMAIAALPFAKGLHAIDLNIGIFYMFAVSSLGVIGILLSGWSSNSKYSLIGAIRSGAQVVSYELSVGLALLSIVMFSGSMQLSTIVESQANG